MPSLPRASVRTRTQANSANNATADDLANADTAAPTEAPPSKTKRKEEMHALQALGEALLRQTPQVWAQCGLPETLQLALKQGQTITAHEGLRRHKQWIGKLMRRVDAAPIQRTLDALALRGQANSARFHALERWRERLLHERDAMTEFITAYPQADARELGTLLRQARQQREQGKPPRAARELFQWLKRQIETQEQSQDQPHGQTPEQTHDEGESA